MGVSEITLGGRECKMKRQQNRRIVTRRGAWGIATTEGQEEQEDPIGASRTKK